MYVDTILSRSTIPLIFSVSRQPWDISGGEGETIHLEMWKHVLQ